MNTCPSDSKLLGSRYSKSATERRRYPAGLQTEMPGGSGGRETDRERAGTETGCVGNKRERKAVVLPAWGGFGPNWRRSTVGSVGRHAGTRARTRIYMRTWIYMHVWWRLSLIRVIDNGREPHAVLVENRRNTWSSERKGVFRHRHGQTRHLDEDSPTRGSPGRGAEQRAVGSCCGAPPSLGHSRKPSATLLRCGGSSLPGMSPWGGGGCVCVGR